MFGSDATSKYCKQHNLKSHLEEYDKNSSVLGIVNVPKTKSVIGKLRLDLLPIRAIEEVARAFQHGVDDQRYPPFDWLNVEGWEDKYFGATLRHLFDWRKGVTKDEKSGLHPLAHAGACVLIMIARTIK